MSIIGFIKGHWANIIGTWKKKRTLTHPESSDLRLASWKDSLQDPTKFYLECFRYFHQRLPIELRNHRKYFTSHRRGFGEDAFHVMWFLIFNELQPESFLEIGVYRGQTLSLAAILARRLRLNCFLQGISPFSPVGDSVSEYRKGLDYYADTLANFAHFSLPAPTLLKAYSTDSSAQELIRSRPWSVIYIDGNHDYEVAKQDWNLCAQNLQPHGLIILDDAGLTTDYHPPLFATGGHPGPSRVAQEVDRNRFREILQVGHNRAFQRIN